MEWMQKWSPKGQNLGCGWGKRTHIKAAFYTKLYTPFEKLCRMPHVIEDFVVPAQAELRRRISAPSRSLKVPKRDPWVQQDVLRVRPSRRQHCPIVDRLWHCACRGGPQHE